MTDPTPDVPTLRRLLAEATPGPWVHSDVLPGHVYARRIFGDVIVGAPRNVACAAAAVNALPGILDRLEAAEGAVARVEALDFESVIDEHFVMWHEMGGNDEPPGEWRCQCGLKFGFSHTAVQHVATALRAALAEVTP